MASQLIGAASGILAALLAISSPAFAQPQGAPAQAGGASHVTPEGEAEAEPAAESSAPSAASLAANRSVEDPNRPLRVIVEILGGYLASAVGAFTGMFLGALIGAPFGLEATTISLLAGTLIGWGITIPFGVFAVGALWQAKGQFGSALLGGAIGTGINVVAYVALGFLSEANPAITNLLLLPMLASFLAPMIGAVLGYEMSHAKALQAPEAIVLFPVQGKGGGVALAWKI